MAANPDRRIKIRWTTSRYVWQKHDGIRVRFDVVEAVEMADRIFAFRMRPMNPKTGRYAGFFSHVCSPPDLAEYPEDEPRVGDSPQWFRLAYVDVLIRSREEADAFITDVKADVCRLKRTLDIMDTLEPTGEATCGDFDSSSSSSESSSSSA